MIKTIVYKVPIYGGYWEESFSGSDFWWMMRTGNYFSIVPTRAPGNASRGICNHFKG